MIMIKDVYYFSHPIVCQDKLNIMFMEVSEMVKGKNFDYLIETMTHYNQLGHVITILTHFTKFET